ncbi:MAG: Rnf-Nqr domain containing protein [Angelakisella sp.]
MKINQISEKKKTLRIKTAPNTLAETEELKLKNRSEAGNNLQKQMLSWDGLVAALTFSVPFVVVIAINLQSALALTAILAAVLLPVSLLRFSMREKLNFPDFLTVPVCALVSVGITAFAAVIIRRYFPQINDSMGTYIYLLAAYPVAAAVFHHKNAKNIGTALAWALRNILYFSCGTIIIGIIRDFLAYNRLIGIPLPASFKLEAAKMPFFGFIALAFLLAAATRIHMAVKLRLAVEETPQTEMPQNAAQDIPQDAPQDNL